MATYDRQDGIGIVYDDLLDDQDSTTGMHNMHGRKRGHSGIEKGELGGLSVWVWYLHNYIMII
jgi:hypothetical protein